MFVASIERIEITTRTRELLLGEEPEKFEVQAFDEEGWLLIIVLTARIVVCNPPPLHAQPHTLLFL